MSANASPNRLLNGLDQADMAIVQPLLELVSLPQGSVLSEAGEPATHLYFPLTAVLALVGTTGNGATVEVAVVGREGVASVSAALGREHVPFRVVTQVQGTALRVATGPALVRLRECRDFYERLLRYSHEVIAQIGQSAICNRFHTARQRLARWLLMTADRVESRELPLTHDFIAHMVGGPRSSVTEAAAALRAAGAIDYRRGMVLIRSLPRLRDEACGCYEAANIIEAAAPPNAGERLPARST